MSLTTVRQGHGDFIDYTPGSAASAGDIAVIGDLVGQVTTDLAANEKGALRLEGVINAPLLGTDDVSAGDKLYWDAGNSRLTLTASTHKVAGYAIEDAGTGVADVDIKLSR